MTAYFVADGGGKHGPYTLDQMPGRIGLGSRVWRQGLGDWAEPGDVPELRALLVGPLLPPLGPTPPGAPACQRAPLGPAAPPHASGLFVLRKVGLLGRRWAVEGAAGVTVARVERGRLVAGAEGEQCLGSLRPHTRFFSGWWTTVYGATGRPVVRARGKRAAAGTWWCGPRGAKLFRTTPYGGAPARAAFHTPDGRTAAALTRMDYLRGEYHLVLDEAGGAVVDASTALLIATCCDFDA